MYLWTMEYNHRWLMLFNLWCLLNFADKNKKIKCIFSFKTCQYLDKHELINQNSLFEAIYKTAFQAEVVKATDPFGDHFFCFLLSTMRNILVFKSSLLNTVTLMLVYSLSNVSSRSVAKRLIIKIDGRQKDTQFNKSHQELNSTWTAFYLMALILANI